jgi:hypothetical protein
MKKPETHSTKTPITKSDARHIQSLVDRGKVKAGDAKGFKQRTSSVVDKNKSKSS